MYCTMPSSCTMILPLHRDVRPCIPHLEDEPMEALASHVALIQAEAERLVQYLSTLPADAWCQPSACQGWEVRDVVAHLVEVAQEHRHILARGVQGETGPPGTISDATIAQSAMAYRERLGETLLPTFRAQYAQFCALLAQLRGGDWDKLCAYAREPRSRPARELLALSIQELAIHGWDIRSRLESAFHLSPESVTVLVQHASKEHRDMHINSGMEGGLQEAMDHLEQVAVSLR